MLSPGQSGTHRYFSHSHYNPNPCGGTFPISNRSTASATDADIDSRLPATAGRPAYARSRAFEVLGRDAHAFLLESVIGGEKIARLQLHRHRARRWSTR